MNENTWGDALRKRISRLQRQLEETESQRDEAGARYIANLHELTAAQKRFEAASELSVERGVENDELKDRIKELEAALRGWVKENGPGGWIDNLREENKKLKDMMLEIEDYCKKAHEMKAQPAAINLIAEIARKALEGEGK